MKLSSKHFDRIRIANRAAADEADGPRCSWEGCAHVGTHRAPLGRGHEGQYRLLCLDHVRLYNKGYNYFDGMSDEAVAAFQRSAVIGHRPTWSMGVRKDSAAATAAAGASAQWSGLYDDPFGLFRGSGNGAAAAPEPPAEPPRRLSGPERQALEILGLSDDVSRDGIKARYKALVKRHHPDANNGDRSSETRLRSVISAYTVLKRGGYV